MPEICLKNQFFGIFSRFHHQFFLFFCTKNVAEPDFWKIFFPADNAGNKPEKPVFWHFLEILPLAFSDFLHKDAYQDCSKHGRVRFLRKIFSVRKYRKYTGNRRFCRFPSDFFLTFRCFFHTNIIYNNVHHQAWLNCQYN